MRSRVRVADAESFHKWLYAQQGRNDPVGEFADNYAKCTALQSATSLSSMYRLIREVSGDDWPRALRAWDCAFGEFVRWFTAANWRHRVLVAMECEREGNDLLRGVKCHRLSEVKVPGHDDPVDTSGWLYQDVIEFLAVRQPKKRDGITPRQLAGELGGRYSTEEKARLALHSLAMKNRGFWFPGMHGKLFVLNDETSGADAMYEWAMKWGGVISRREVNWALKHFFPTVQASSAGFTEMLEKGRVKWEGDNLVCRDCRVVRSTPARDLNKEPAKPCHQPSGDTSIHDELFLLQAKLNERLSS